MIGTSMNVPTAMALKPETKVQSEVLALKKRAVQYENID
jgi:hypothetical protein